MKTLKLMMCKKCNSFCYHRKVAEIFVTLPSRGIKITVLFCPHCGEYQIVSTNVLEEQR